MSAYERLAKFYTQHLRTTLARDVRKYAKRGYVFIAPDYVLIGERVGEGWFIRAACGSNCFGKFADLMPHYLPFIGWARAAHGRHHVRWHSTDRILRLIKYEKLRQVQVMPAEGTIDSQAISGPGAARL